MKKLLALLLALIMCVGLFAGCGDSSTNPSSQPTDGTNTGEPGSTNPSTNPDGSIAEYTWHSAETALGNNWNPHTWETNADATLFSYQSGSLWVAAPLDSENGIMYFALQDATSVTDVTASHQDDLVKFGVNLQPGKTAETTTEGFVREIKIREDLCWEDGTPINADTFIYSMQQQIAPEMHNYRGNTYYDGDGAVAGAAAYYFGGSTMWHDAEGAYTLDDITITDTGATLADGTPIAIGASIALSWLDGDALKTYVDYYGDNMFDSASFDALYKLADVNGAAPLTQANLDLLVATITANENWGESADDAINYFVVGEVMEQASWDDVGFYKVDDYTLIYVSANYLSDNLFYYNVGMDALVYEPLYEAGKDTSGTLVTTDYGTAPEKFMSWGPYRMDNYQTGRQVTFTRNENWYGWEKQEDGSLISYTNYEVDGQHVEQYMTTKIIIDVMDASAQKQAFLKGELDVWVPGGDDLPSYATSDQLYRTPQSFSQRLFLNANLNALREMDNSKGNQNSVVFSNINFRKAFSLAIDRAEFVSVSAGWNVLYTLVNDLYYYNMFEDPSSRFRDTDEAMQAVCDLYGIEYGEGTAYPTLKDAYKSVTGYNLTEAQALMKQACEEVVAAGLYTEGDPITIRMAWAAGSLTSTNNNHITLLNKYINAAAEGSGFGPITLDGLGNVEDRYGDVPKGEYAIGFGAWGGDTASPHSLMQLYMDPDKNEIQELGNYDPKSATLTLNVNGQDRTETWQWWSNSLTGSGEFTNESFEFKNDILARLELAFLEQYWCIPLAQSNSCQLVSYKVSFYTDVYNTFYGFGGLRLYRYNYTDAEWQAFLAENGSNLSYE